MERWIFLSGMMGSGKSTVGRLLAKWNGTPLIDLDARIEVRAGMTIPEIFADEGEDAFRRLESEEARRMLSSDAPTVVALGGGTVVSAETRRLLLKHGVIVTLRASAAELARRLEGGAGRPILARGEATQILAQLLEQRAGAYAECHGVVETEGRTIGEIAEEVASIARAAPIPVPLGTRTYRVEIGFSVLARLPERVPEDGAILIVSDENVHAAWGARARELLAPRSPIEIVLPPGEAHKGIATVETIWDRALEAGVDRRATIVALGGGVVGDLAGFAASTLLRGVRLVQVPTSVLAMVDASVGGKTGFDRAQGKNLIGTFHQPEHVLADIETLSTLPDAELRAGLAEVVKSAWIDSEAAVAALERDAAALLARDPAALERAVRMSVRVKADIVARDERESSARMLLNLGHTIGHAIEAARGYVGIRHGEAVAIGMLAAFRVAALLGDPRAGEHGERMAALLRKLELPARLEGWIDARTLGFVGSDKKRGAGKLTFVVPHEPGNVELAPIALDRLGAANLF